MSLHLDVSPQAEARFTAAAQQKGIDPATLLERMISDYLPPLAQEQELGDFGGRSIADVILEIGTVKGGPPDLSTNPKYMEGFGETKNPRKLTT
jgi:hypothetical protein